MTAVNIDRFTASGAPRLAFGARGEITTTFPQTTLGRGDDGAGGAAENILAGGGASSAAPK